MVYCVNCGAPIPDEQRVCSMCYGDPDYGKDRYYENYRKEWERQQEDDHGYYDDDR